MEIDPSLVLNPNLTIAEGGIRPFNRINQESWWLKRLAAVGEKQGFSIHTPIRDLSEEAIQKILYGTGKKNTPSLLVDMVRVKLMERLIQSTYEGVIPTLERRHHANLNPDFVKKISNAFMRVHECQTCHGRQAGSLPF